MPRRIDLTTPPEMRARVVERLRDTPGVVSIVCHRGVSVASDGDLVTIDLTTSAAPAVLATLDELGALETGSVTISQPTAVIAPSQRHAIEEEGNEAVWEEVGALMRQDTNTSANFLLLMACAGAVAAFGLVADTVHIVVGAMLIAPGFEPLVRIAFGLLGKRHTVVAGLRATAAGYGVLAGAAAAAVTVALLFSPVTADGLRELFWVRYWSKVEPAGVAVALIAGVAGGLIVSTRLKVLATGVMVALALVPSMALVGMGIATGDPSLAFAALLRWLADALSVMVAGGTTLAVKKVLVHRRTRRDTV